MAIRPRIGYLVPCFPGPTHPAFWREILALEAQGVEVFLYSTRPPPPGQHVHARSAARRTEYLARGPALSVRALPALPWAELKGAERGFGADLALSLGPARALAESAEG